MTYVVNENCIKCKYMDCVEVCPVDCFYEGENMLVIHPDECIDCGVCEPECPVDAIKPDTEPGLEKWLEINTQYALVWPNITVKREPPPDAKDWEGKPDKAKLLSPGDIHNRLTRPEALGDVARHGESRRPGQVEIHMLSAPLQEPRNPRRRPFDPSGHVRQKSNIALTATVRGSAGLT